MKKKRLPPPPPLQKSNKVVQLGRRGPSPGTWVKGQPRPAGIKSGRKKGSKNRLPRSLKQSIDQVCQDLVATEQPRIRRAFIRGLDARPPASYAYLQLIAAYTVGRPTERIQIEGQVNIQISAAGQHLKTKLAQMADALAAARARASEEAARKALPWGPDLSMPDIIDAGDAAQGE